MTTELTLACAPYDRMVPLFTNQVTIEGIRLRTVPLRDPAEIFRAMIRDGAFDITEMSLSQCFEQASRPHRPFVALPVFPSRCFRHGFVFVNTKAAIREPADLAGKRIGVQHYGMSAAVWIRGALRREYGVDFSGVTWVEAPVNQPGPSVKVSGSSGGRDLVIEAVTDRTLSDMLADGSIDAMIGAWVPDSFRVSPDVTRLFADYRAEEKRYYRATGVFPIMHALAIRSDVAAADPGLARRVFDACVTAKDLAMIDHRSTGALSTMLPWLYDDLDEIDELFGTDFWSYGLTANRDVLTAFGNMLVTEGALDRWLPLEEVFLPFD